MEVIFEAVLRIRWGKDSAGSQTNVITEMTDEGFMPFKM